MKQGLHFYARTIVVTIIFATILYSLTGCFCKECLAQGATQREEQGKEILVDLMPVAAAPINKVIDRKEEAPPMRDFSALYIFPAEKTCPLGIQSIHTQVTAGPNISFKNSGDDVYGSGSHTSGVGMQVGFGSTFKFNDKWSVSPSLLYKQNKAGEKGSITDGEPGAPSVSFEDKYSYSYLSAPIVAQYNLTDDLSLSAGPELNYLLKAKVKSNNSYGGSGQSNTDDITDNSVKLGLGLQVGMKYQIPNSNWGVQAVYDHRLSRLNEKNPEVYGNYEVPAWRMKSVQVGVTCLICNLLKGK